jgi:hypothetical protein
VSGFGFNLFLGSDNGGWLFRILEQSVGIPFEYGEEPARLEGRP